MWFEVLTYALIAVDAALILRWRLRARGKKRERQAVVDGSSPSFPLRAAQSSGDPITPV